MDALTVDAEDDDATLAAHGAGRRRGRCRRRRNGGLFDRRGRCRWRCGGDGLRHGSRCRWYRRERCGRLGGQSDRRGGRVRLDRRRRIVRVSPAMSARERVDPSSPPTSTWTRRCSGPVTAGRVVNARRSEPGMEALTARTAAPPLTTRSAVAVPLAIRRCDRDRRILGWSWRSTTCRLRRRSVAAECLAQTVVVARVEGHLGAPSRSTSCRSRSRASDRWNFTVPSLSRRM